MQREQGPLGGRSRQIAGTALCFLGGIHRPALASVRLHFSGEPPGRFVANVSGPFQDFLLEIGPHWGTE